MKAVRKRFSYERKGVTYEVHVTVDLDEILERQARQLAHKALQRPNRTASTGGGVVKVVVLGGTDDEG